MNDRLLLIEVDDHEMQAVIGNALAQLENPRPLLDAIAATLIVNIKARFVSKTDPSGAPWAPLAEATLARKKGRGSTLEDTERMKASLDRNIGSDFVEVGFGESYAAYHELGTRRMPRRGMLTADPDTGTLGAGDRQDIADDVAAWLRNTGL